MTIKGQMKWAKNIKPEYFWYNGIIKSVTAKDQIDPGQAVKVSWPEDSRLANLGGFYMPGRDRGQWLDILGWITVLGALAGVVLHATGRVFANGNNGKNGENSAK